MYSMRGAWLAQWLEVLTDNHTGGSRVQTPLALKNFDVLCSWVRHLTLITPWFESYIKLVVPCWPWLHVKVTDSFEKSRGLSTHFESRTIITSWRSYDVCIIYLGNFASFSIKLWDITSVSNSGNFNRVEILREKNCSVKAKQIG